MCYTRNMSIRFWRIGLGFIGVGLCVLSMGDYSSAAESAALPPQIDPARKTTVEPSPPLRLTFVGDIMFDRAVRDRIAKYGAEYPFALIGKSLRSNLTIANLEGPFTSSGSVATTTRLIFTFDPIMAPVLKKVGVNAVSLANNHTLNFGQRGLDQTRAVLRQAKIDTFGDPQNRAGRSRIKTVNGRKIALVGYHGLVGGIPGIVTEITALKKRADLVIVMPHWGAEYQLGIQPRLQREARQLIDAGADFVIGAHPHVVEPVEIYRGKFIAYSLGNFIFDQDWSRDTMEGLMLRLNITNRRTVIEFIPVKVARGQASIMTGDRKTAMLQRLANDSVLTTSKKRTLAAGRIILP